MASSFATPVTYCHGEFKTKPGDKSDYIMETFILDGEYALKHQYLNKNRAVLSDFFDMVENGKSVYRCGNILYKNNEPKIWHYIDLIIEATYNKNLSVNVDGSVRDRVQKIDGTICPTRDTIFAYDGKLFVLYGRYIYGYDDPYVRFVKEKVISENDFDEDQNDEEDYNDEEESDYDEIGCRKRLPASLSEDEIVLPTIPYELNKVYPMMFDHNFSFAIIDAKTQVLLAFASYR